MGNQSMFAHAVAFWVMVDMSGDCWEWRGHLDKDGYGRLSRRHLGRKRELRAHRVAWELRFGSVTPDQLVLHRCDNRRCVRPDHLFLGSHADNAHDRARKGRKGLIGRKKEKNAKLTAAQVAEIRRSADAGRILATRFGVSTQNIYAIRKRLSWTHIP